MSSENNRAATEVVNEETTIIQNITLGPFFVSDIKMSWGPRECKDLTWEDPDIIKKSANLRAALVSGALRRLTKSQYEKTLAMQYEREKKEILKEAGNKPTYKKIKNGNNKDMLAEKIEVGQAKKKGEQLNFSGGANDTLSYVKALEIAEGIARDRGDDLTPESFAEAVEADPNLVPQLLKNYRTASNSDKQNIAYFAMPPERGQKTTSIGKEAMTNFNRDRRYAGAGDMFITDFGQQEEFIIEDDDDEFDSDEEMIDQEDFNGELIDDVENADWDEAPIIISEED